MKRLNAKVLLCLLLVLASIIACQKDYENYPRIGEGPIDFTDYSKVTLTMKAIDINGTPLNDVSLEVSDQSATTNHLGVAIFNSVSSINKQLKVKASKSGFAPAFYNVKINSLTCYGEVALSPTTSHNFSSNSNNTISYGETEVEFSSGSFVNMNGETYNGSVNVDFTYINPTQNNFERSMPGADFMGINNENEEQFLTSYGALSLEISDDYGAPLQIADGKTATIRVPIPDVGTTSPNLMPMWYFDEDKQMWIEDGQAIREGNEYVAKVSHFTWWNYDIPIAPNTYIAGCLINCFGKPAAAGVAVDLGPLIVYTDSNGCFEANVAANIPINISFSDPSFEDVYVNGVANGEYYNLGYIEATIDCIDFVQSSISILDCNNEAISVNYYCSDCFPTSGTLSAQQNNIFLTENITTTLMLSSRDNGYTKFIDVSVVTDDIVIDDVKLCPDSEPEIEEEENFECNFFSIDHFSDGTLTDKHFYQNINAFNVGNSDLVILAGDIVGAERENLIFIYLQVLSIDEGVTYNFYGLDNINSQAAMLVINKGNIFIPVNGQIYISKNSNGQLKLNYHSDNIEMPSINQLTTYVNQIDIENLSVANQFLVNYLTDLELGNLNFSGRANGHFCK